MKTQILLATILVLTTTQSSPSAEQHLLGCGEPSVVSNALTRLQQNNWKKVSASNVMSIWPNRFDELKCESETPCRSLVSKNRVISGHCECCEAFVFDMERNQDGSLGDHLNNIIIHYSDPDKKVVIAAAKRLAQGAGLPEAQIAVIGHNPIERFEWRDSRESVRQTYILELRFTSAGQNWELYLSLGADPL